jgi:hypothetical protein
MPGRWWLFQFYHWSGYIAFGFTQAQAREIAQGYIWGVGGYVGWLCTLVLGGILAGICALVVGFIIGSIAQAASGCRYFQYRIVTFAYGWHWTWWGGYPYFYHAWTA